MTETQNDDGGMPVRDLIGVGFGPANLALAALIDEETQDLGRPVDSLFLERRPGFAWHPDMLIHGTRIQLSFLKDLVTLRNPSSRFSFLRYLQDKGRLVSFVNLREFFPTRLEFNDYYRWVASQVSDQVAYGRRVVEIAPVPAADGGVDLLRVVAENIATGEREEHLTRNLVVAPGGEPFVPGDIDLTDDGRVFHCRDFLSRIEGHFPDRDAAHRFVIVGSGQSAAEIFQYLYTHYPKARVTAAMRRYAYKPADESHFVNEIFNPGMVDFLYDLTPPIRKKVIDDHYDTNYSAVDLSLIREIYVEMYERQVLGQGGLEVRNLLELRDVDLHAGDAGITIHFQDLSCQQPETVEADCLILATGYQRRGQPPLLDQLQPYLETSSDGCFDVEREYLVRSAEEFRPRLFLQGFCERTHGLSDTLLSVLPVRAQEIFGALALDGVGTSDGEYALAATRT